MPVWPFGPSRTTSVTISAGQAIIFSLLLWSEQPPLLSQLFASWINPSGTDFGCRCMRVWGWAPSATGLSVQLNESFTSPRGMASNRVSWRVTTQSKAKFCALRRLSSSSPARMPSIREKASSTRWSATQGGPSCSRCLCTQRVLPGICSLTVTLRETWRGWSYSCCPTRRRPLSKGLRTSPRLTSHCCAALRLFLSTWT
mmetsp:Transcript_29275/g.67878  ORF Transcript_29275/g.67878 Transcript_29275/m.67878 type:complete len:200 (+) Transcript_29275:851-1450(+)